MAGRILILEDNRDMAFGLCLNLECEGYDVDIAYDGSTALHKLESTTPDLVLLDLMLPDMSGFDFLQTIRTAGHVFPVMILSARASETDRVAGLRMGAQDYVTKPFSLAELLERIDIRIKSRDTRLEQSGVVRDGLLSVDLRMQTAHVGSTPVGLTKKQVELLTVLIRERGHVLTRRDLLRRVWNTSAPIQTRTVDFHVMKIREKLNPHGYGQRLRTVSGKGFTWQ